MYPIFTKAFWATALEHTLVGFSVAYVAIYTAVPDASWMNTETALKAGGFAALYAFIKQLGGTQAMSMSLKVGVKGRHARGVIRDCTE